MQRESDNNAEEKHGYKQGNNIKQWFTRWLQPMKDNETNTWQEYVLDCIVPWVGQRG